MRSTWIPALLMTLAPGCAPPDEEPDPSSTSGADSGPADQIDMGGPHDVAGACPVSQGPTMVAGDITEDTTWTADGSPYQVASDLAVRAELTLEPCVEVRLAGGVNVTLRDGGSIVGIATESTPILIDAEDPSAPFGTIRLYNGGPLRLAHATIQNGGEAGNAVPTAAAMIDAQGVDAPSREAIDFDHVSLLDSASQGILLRDGAEFSAASNELVVSGSSGHPVATWASGLSTLPTGSYEGNGRDAIFVIGSGPAAIDRDVTMHDRGVPYVIGGQGTAPELRVGGAGSEGSPLLTIEAGVELRFPEDGVLHVDFGATAGTAVGALAVEGTADAPVVFTGDADAPAPGAWLGIFLWNIPDARTRIEHARVEFAGGVSQTGSNSCPGDGSPTADAAIRLVGGQAVPSAPAGRIVSNTTIRASGANGIDRGWVGDPIDYAETNVFEELGACVQTYPEPEPPSVCPDPVPCETPN